MYSILKTTALNPSLNTDVIGISVGSVYATTFAVENKKIENLILMSPHSSVENAIEQQMSNIPTLYFHRTRRKFI